MGFFSSKNYLPVEGKTVLLTGASQGMGKSVARMLSAKGANVVIVARNKNKLAEALEETKAAAKSPQTQRFLTISADVTSAPENARMLAETTAWNNGYPPDVVWGIAGAAKPTLFLDSDYETMHSQMDVNYWSGVYLARETLQVWLKTAPEPKKEQVEPDARHFILTSSVACFAGLTGYAPYSPAKSALRNLIDTLRSEMNFYNGARKHKGTSSVPAPPTDMIIHGIYPGTITSPGLDVENSYKHDITKSMEESDTPQTPDEAAAASIAGLERGELTIAPNFQGKLMLGAMQGNIPRQSWLSTLGFGALASLVWLYMAPELESQSWNYGKKWGLAGRSEEDQEKAKK